MNPKSHTLFHFTRSSDVLKLIMKNGFWPRYCLEDVKWLGYDADFIAYPMVCFCDIPISRAEEHVKFYGEYGIGLTKEWAESNKITPILYVSNNSNLQKTFRKIVSNAFRLSDAIKDEALKSIRHLTAHTKPTEGNMLAAGGLVNKEFYQESEWRYVPTHPEINDYLKKSDFDIDTILKENNELTFEKCGIKFTPKDVKYIFVRNDSDIPSMINFIHDELDSFPSTDLKILMSRVISLESIKRDL